MKSRKKSAVVVAHVLHHLFVILHAHARIQLRIGPAEVHHELASMLAKGRKVGIGGVQHLVQFLHPRRILIDIELAEDPVASVSTLAAFAPGAT